MQRIERLIAAKIHFAVMNYKKTPAGLPRNAFELLVINPENGELNLLPLDPLDIKILKSRKYQRQVTIKNKNAEGQVYEFMNFKQVYEDAVKEFEKLMEEHNKANKN
jgi:hypothetical protein